MSKITIPQDIIQSATQAQIRRAGANFAESISAYLGNPITGEIIVSSSDKKGLVWIYGLGSEPSSSFTAVNTGLNKQDMYLGAPILVTRGVNGYNVTGKNPDTSPEFYEGSEALNAQEPIYISQIYFGTIHPYGTSLQLLVIGAQYDDYDVVDIVTADFSTETVQDTLAANITLPTVNNTAKGVLIQLDPSTETLSYKQSATYAATIQPRQAYRAGLLPTVDDGLFRVGYFNLTYGVTTFTYGDIWSCPEFISSGAGNVTGIPPNDDNAIARFDDLTGTVISSSNAYLYDSGEIDIYLSDAAAAGLFIAQHATQTEAPLIIADSALNRQTVLGANGAATFNEEGNDVDFRVETDTNANALFVDGGSNNVGIGTGTPDAALLLDLVSVVKALGLPTMTTTERNAIASPPNRAMIYNSTTHTIDVRADGIWVTLATDNHSSTHEEAGTDPISGDLIESSHNGVNYVETSNTIGGQFEGIDDRLGLLEHTADGILLYDPTLQTWTPLNQSGTFTKDTADKRLVILADGNATRQVRGWYFTAPGTPYIATFYIQQQTHNASGNGTQVFHRQNSTGELRTFGYRSDGTNLPKVSVSNWNSATSINANIITGGTFMQDIKWWQIEDDGIDVFYRISPDGIIWQQIYTIGRTTFLTPDELGFGMDLLTASTYDASASLLSLELE